MANKPNQNRQAAAPKAPKPDAVVKEQHPEHKDTAARYAELGINAGTEDVTNRPGQSSRNRQYHVDLAEPTAPDTDYPLTNGSMLNWPSDIWGLTKDLRSAFVTAGSRVGGGEDKMDLLMATIRLGVAHIEARYEEGKVAVAARLAEREAELAAEAANEAGE